MNHQLQKIIFYQNMFLSKSRIPSSNLKFQNSPNYKARPTGYFKALVITCLLGLLHLGANAQTLTGSAANLDFGIVTPGETASQLLTLTNTSPTGSLTITGFVFTGEMDYVVLVPNNDPFVSTILPPNGTLNVYVQFSPNSGGPRAGSLEVTYTSITPGPALMVQLNGSGCTNNDPGTNGDPFLEQGGKVIMEAESHPATDDWTQYDLVEGEISFVNIDPMTGDTLETQTAPEDMTVYVWEGNNNTGWTGAGNMTYTFTVSDASEPYRLWIRAHKLPGFISTEANDIWLYNDDPGVVVKIEAPNNPLPPPHQDVTEVEVSGLWFKAFNSVGNYTWFTNGAVNINGVWFEGFSTINFYFPAPGTYSFTVAGRATGFVIDKFALMSNGGPSGAEVESPRGVPQDCPTIWFQDSDSDGYGFALASSSATSQPAGFVDNALDCDDNATAINPFAAEVDGDGIDNNCDGYAEEGFATANGCLAMRIDAGQEVTAHTTPAGVAFTEDLGFANSPNKEDYSGQTVLGTAFTGLYQHLKSTILSAEDIAGTDTLKYTVPVGDNGTFVVKLHFVEHFWDNPGQRVFNIDVEKGTADAISITDFDILSQTNGNKHTAHVVTLFANINDGVFNLEMVPTVNKPVIAGVEVLPIGSCGDENITFPVEWLNVQAFRRGERVELLWQTANELQNDFFTIERSADGQIFQPIGNVNSKSESQDVQTYRSYDEAPIWGKNFYRIKQTDLDGNFSFSRIVEAQFNTGISNVFPNPVRLGQDIKLELEIGQPQKLEYKLMNHMGQSILHLEEQLTQGSYEKLFSTRKLSPGYYMLQVKNENGTELHKVIVE